jgi:hypothetical protein
MSPLLRAQCFKDYLCVERLVDVGMTVQQLLSFPDTVDLIMQSQNVFSLIYSEFITFEELLILPPHMREEFISHGERIYDLASYYDKAQVEKIKKLAAEQRATLWSHPINSDPVQALMVPSEFQSVLNQKRVLK